MLFCGIMGPRNDENAMKAGENDLITPHIRLPGGRMRLR
jgi:hypothetical protein